MHEIEIVGAKKTAAGGMVFYRDPMRTSDPNEPKEVLAMSYDRLLSEIGNIYGERTIRKKEGRIFTDIDQMRGPFALSANESKMNVIVSELGTALNQLTQLSSMTMPPTAPVLTTTTSSQLTTLQIIK